jgi:hypothetical protein
MRCVTEIIVFRYVAFFIFSYPALACVNEFITCVAAGEKRIVSRRISEINGNRLRVRVFTRTMSAPMSESVREQTRWTSVDGLTERSNYYCNTFRTS